MMCVCEGEQNADGEIEMGVVAVDTGSGDIVYDSFIDDALHSKLETVIFCGLNTCFVCDRTDCAHIDHVSFMDDALHSQLETVILWTKYKRIYVSVYVHILCMIT